MLIYTGLVQQALEDMARTVSSLGHIAAKRVLVVASPKSSGGATGFLAQCHGLHPLQVDTFSYWYRRGTRTVVRVTPWARHENTRVVINGIEMRYVIMLRLPRLLLHHPGETILHELIHIGSGNDGRLRPLRHGRRFDALSRQCWEEWEEKGNPDLVKALQMDYRTVVQKWGTLVGLSFGPLFRSRRVRPLEDPPPISAHPDFLRKNLTYDPAKLEVRDGQWTPAEAPGLLTEGDLVYRVYTPQGARRISAHAVRLGTDRYGGFGV